MTIFGLSIALIIVTSVLLGVTFFTRYSLFAMSDRISRLDEQVKTLTTVVKNNL